MRYKSFRIRNFKGIKDTTVNLETIGGAAVFTLVGLNESGKTTILEAIHSFAPDAATSELVGGDEGTGVPVKDRVPRHLISTFTGDVSVVATLALSEADREKILASALSAHSLHINPDTLPLEIQMERIHRFANGDFRGHFLTVVQYPQIRHGAQKKWREPDSQERVKIRDVIHAMAPDIAYFPTFVFDFPEAIFLTDRGGTKDKFYRRVFQDILDFDNRDITIERDIVRRIRQKNMVLPWLKFFSAWVQHDDRAKIQHIMDRAGSIVTKVVFGRWNEIFGEETRGKEIFISSEVAEGETKDAEGNKIKTDEHDIYITFQVRDGTRRFNVNDRSLGFRWFFAFMLFTQFRVARSASKSLLFLFDEPASNLHAAAQQKLIDSFPEIAKNDHTLIYTTHSHYMIEPKWLEQTFIVTNRSDTPPSSMLDALSLDDESLDIQAATYRSFVNKHPGQTTYFQPILDRLDVIPSKFDMKNSSVILEGRSDYYILRYGCKMLKRKELPLLPGLGAGTFGALAALHVGWNLKFLFVLDGDKQGKIEKIRYVNDFGIPLDKVVTLDEFIPGTSAIESLLDDTDLNLISKELGLTKLPNKSQIARFFQERLASGKVEKLSSSFTKRAASLLSALEARLNS